MNKLFSSFLMISLFFLASLFSVVEDSVYVCAIFHNEERFLAEWVQFHLDQGVEKIYMYNNKSNEASIKVLQPYVERGDVILIDWHKENGSLHQWAQTQCSAYNDCAMRCIDKCG